ncbi:MAG: hypothetical protein WC860_05240 [Candidatus Margulisiibacteriota bacterium]|jgi:hypothetical protein
MIRKLSIYIIFVTISFCCYACQSIASVLPTKGPYQLKPIKSIFEFNMGLWLLFLFLILILVLSGFIFLNFLKLKNNKKLSKNTQDIDQKKMFLEILEKLEADFLLKNSKEVGTQLSKIIIAVLSEFYQKDLIALTSKEIMRTLKNQLSEPEAKELKEILNILDLIKFTQDDFNEQVLQKVLINVKNFIIKR